MDRYKQITEPIRVDLEKCKALYGSQYIGENRLLGRLLSYIHQSDGKMMRPVLALLCARLTGQMSESAVYTAAAYEFFHNASLVHDDVVDDSDERRGRSSVNNLFNNKCAVLVGDYMLAQGLNSLSKTDNPALIHIMSEAAQSLAHGELLQLSISAKDCTEEQYLEIISCKTAALFRACAQSGAISVGACDNDIENMRQLGEAIGICFQIKDDMLDGEIEADKAETMLSTYLDKATTILNSYPDSETKTALNSYIEYVVEREY